VESDVYEWLLVPCRIVCRDCVGEFVAGVSIGSSVLVSSLEDIFLMLSVTLIRCIRAKEHGVYDAAWTVGSRHTIRCIPRFY